MSDYVVTIERRERNPRYVAPPNSQESGCYNRDQRTPEQVEFFLTRVLLVTLGEAEYEAVKRAIVTHWNDKQTP